MGSYDFTLKAIQEMEADYLTETDVLESVVNATKISKRIKSKRPPHEPLYIIKGSTSTGLRIYTKGKIGSSRSGERLYILISSKKSIG